MSYRIDYQSVANPQKMKKRHYPILIFASCLIAALLFNTILKDQRAVLLRILFPGDAAATTAAVDTMLTQLKAGEAFRDALIAFCQQVIAG